MPTNAVYCYLLDGFADWEPAHALAELRRHGHYRVETVALTREPVVSMGGLRVTPDKTVDEVEASDVAVFILPGGDRWESEPVDPELARLLRVLDAQGVPIAAICGATTAMARIGLLKGRKHTSNGLDYLRAQVPTYNEAANYVDAPAVRDAGLVTASGLAHIEFARALFDELQVLDPADRSEWERIFRSGLFPRPAP